MLQIDDANRRDVDPADCMNRRQFANAVGADNESKWNVLRAAAPPQVPESIGFLPQAGANAAVRNRNEHSGAEQRDVTLLGILNEKSAAFVGQVGFEGSDSLMKS